MSSTQNETSPRTRMRLGESARFDSAFTDRVRLYLRVTFIVNLVFTILALMGSRHMIIRLDECDKQGLEI